MVFSHLIDIINVYGDYIFDNKPIEKLKLGEKTMRKQIIFLKDDQITEVGYHCNQRSINFIRAIRDQANKAMQAAFVNVKLGIVQVKLRFHGGTRGKERVKELVSHVTEIGLLV